MSVYCYTRTSDVETLEAQDAIDGIDGIVQQESLRLHTYALSQGMNVTASYVDLNQKWAREFAGRPEALNLINKLEKGDIILACSLERVFSSCDDMLNTIDSLKTKGVRMFVVDLAGEVTANEFSPPFSRLLKVFQKLEKRRYTERIKAVKQNQRDKGRFLGGSRPFGYMIHSNGRLIENPTEQKVLKRIIAMKKQGNSLRAISTEVSTPMAPVSFKTVQRLIKRHDKLFL